MEWLSHSRKKYCELCEHPYKFSPVYRTDMPDTIPISLFIIQFGKKIINLIYVILRACLVTCVWLFILPYFTVSVWRFYFWSGKVLHSQILKIQQMTNHSLIMHLYHSSMNNTNTLINNEQITKSDIASAVAGFTIETVKATGTALTSSINQTIGTNESSTLPLQYNLLGIEFTASDIKNILLDCFQGQIITCVVVVVFIAMFHLREWIVQNIPEELLEDGDNNNNNNNDIVIDDIPFDHGVDLPFNEQHDHQQQQEEEIEGNNEDDELEDPIINALLGENINNTTVNQNNDHHQHWGNINETEDLHHDWRTNQSRRAVSEPPPSINFLNEDDNPFLSSNKYNNNNNNNNNNDSDHYGMWQRRGTSAEPQLESWQNTFSSFNETSEYAVAESSSSSFGRPPHAPRLRHAQTLTDHSQFPSSNTNRQDSHILNEQPDNHQDDEDDNIHQPRVRQFDFGLQPVIIEEDEERDDANEVIEIDDDEDDDGVENNGIIVIDDDDDDDDDDIQVQEQPNNNEENGAEDILDVLDAVGMRGSLWTLIQNLALIALLISLCLGASVWMPYLIGMTFIMADIFDIIRIPLLVTRMVTDPVIDWLINFAIHVIWPSTASAMETVQITLSNYYSSMPESSQRILDILLLSIKGSPSSPVNESTIINNSSATIQVTVINHYINEGFTTLLHLINQVEPTMKAIVAWYKHLAVGTSAMDHLMCIIIGYLVVLVMSSSYLSRTVAQVVFGDRAQGTLRQQYLILKVGMFLIIELFMFPVVCGILLDFSVMPLFSVTASKWRVIQYMMEFPLSSTFIHWIIGTAFMFMFALLITSCRHILRPGVMWFIRDPNNPQFHPIREIVEKPVWDQLKKLGASGIMYTIIVVVGVGGIIHAIPFLIKDMLPLHWNSSSTLSVVPFDLILLEIAVPAAIRYFKPKRVIKALSIKWMKFLCRKLRLTSFMFGVRRISEEGTLRYTTWTGWFKSWFTPTTLIVTWRDTSIYNVVSTSGTFELNGQMVRAPKHDSVQFIPGRRMLIPVDPTTFLPLNQRERMLGHPAARGDGGEAANTVIVYTPPRFRQRVLLFIILLWLSGSILICSFTILPIFIGRFIFKHVFHVSDTIHDMYAFAIGSALMLVIGTIISRITHAINDAISENNPNTRFIRFFKHIYQLCHLGFKWVFFIVNFGMILPVLFGLIMELYFIFPVRDFDDKFVPFDLLPLWVRGFACMNILHGMLRVVAANPLQANLRLVRMKKKKEIYI
ncbi:unnamed protein product [Cunninghamella blakesleeana]